MVRSLVVFLGHFLTYSSFLIGILLLALLLVLYFCLNRAVYGVALIIPKSRFGSWLITQWEWALLRFGLPL
jgi:hypothetical protein